MNIQPKITDKQIGDFDTVGIYQPVLSDDTRPYITKWFIDGGNDWIEIDAAEYQERSSKK